MLILTRDLREFVELLNSYEVRYLVVGGYAVAYHGSPRTTGDIDFFVEVSCENAQRLIVALDDFGFGSLGISQADFLEPDVVIQLGYPPNRIDLINKLSGVEFSAAWERRLAVETDGLTLWMVDRETLLINKAATGRAKDLADVAALS